MIDSLISLWTLIQDNGVPFIMFLIAGFLAVGGKMKWYVFGWYYDQMLAEQKEKYKELLDDRNDWRTTSLSNTSAAERALFIIERNRPS